MNSADPATTLNAPAVTEDRWGSRVPSWLPRCWLACCRSLPSTAVFRRIALWMRRPLKYGLKGPVDTTVWGLKLRLDPRGNLSEERWLFMPGFSDALERRILADLLGPGSVFLDIGANAGFYSFWIWSNHGDRVRIEAFEPDPTLCARIRFNIAANKIRSLNLHPLALSDHRGTASLAIGSKNRGTNRLGTDGGNTISVPVTTLVDFVSSHGIDRIDAMKIDVEGHEQAILGHFFQHAPRALFPRLLVCETLDKGPSPLRELIGSAGYRAMARGRMNTVFRLDE
jgi:FkbM family methyltransferase